MVFFLSLYLHGSTNPSSVLNVVVIRRVVITIIIIIRQTSR